MRTRGAGVLLVASLGVAWGGQEWRTWRMGDNERHAARARFTLISAECEFRAGDYDRNGINDYWTGDIAGLYRFGLIERGLAQADDHPLSPLVPKPVPWHGYFVHILAKDESTVPPEEYAQVTDLPSGKVHHREKVAVCLYPAEPGVSGRYTYLLNDYGCIRRHLAPGPNGAVPRNWPSDDELRRFWTNDCGG